jgi:hypothetical protein
MKKLLSIVIVGILVLSGLGAAAGHEHDEKEYKSDTIVFSQPVLSESENYISIELEGSTSNSWEKNKPTLPVITKTYTFPFGTQIENVEVTFSDSIEQEISKPIMHSPELHIFSTASVSNNEKESEIVMTYSDIDVYPENRFGYKTGAGLKGEEHVIYLTVHLYPLQYNPSENTIYYSENAVIDYSYIPPQEPVVFPDEYDFLILAPAEFESALQPLVDHKNNLDPPVKTTLVTLEEIPSVGEDEPESIKYYIKDAIETWGITYVLLVGSWVELEDEPPESQYAKFPMRKAWIDTMPHEDWFPSDLYYADIYNSSMEFADWDFDDDGKHAEYRRDLPNMDVHPDVYLGRLPCSNVNEVDTIVEKIIQYKSHNKMTKKILQIGGDSVTGDSTYEGEYANEKVLENLIGYNSLRLWGSSDPKRHAEITKDSIADGFKSNVDFVDFSGHGSWASWATHPPNDEDTWIPPETMISPYSGFLYVDYDLYMINNGQKYPVVVFTACSNNKFTESETCIGWKSVNKKGGGGIAAFAESGIGHGPGRTDFVEHCIGWMEVNVFDELFNTKILGQVWSNCVTEYYNTFELELDKEDYKTMLEFSMFGDPTLIIEDGIDPKIKTIEKPLFNELLLKLMDHFPRLARLLKPIIARLG